MNLTNINSNTTGNIGMVDHVALEATQGVPDSEQARPAKPDLTITNATVALGEVESAEISEDTLARDDGLGRLITGAFNLPPPPMPHFGE